MEEELVASTAFNLTFENGRVGFSFDVHHAPGTAVQP